MSALDLLIPLIVAVLAWWASTGAILVVNRQGEEARWLGMAAATLLLGAGIAGVAWSAERATVLGAYAGFASALAIWAWHELSFLSGLVTGPRARAAPPGLGPWRRFVAALGTIFWHELAIAATALIVIAQSWGAENQTALMTFLVLWVMRLSAKVNIFLGVPNVTEEFLPPHLDFLKSHFRKRPMNAVFPVSVTAGAIATAWIAHGAFTAATPFAATEAVLVATLLGLAVIEHWFLVLPIPDAALWSWLPGMGAAETRTRPTARTGIAAPRRQETTP